MPWKCVIGAQSERGNSWILIFPSSLRSTEPSLLLLRSDFTSAQSGTSDPQVYPLLLRARMKPGGMRERSRNRRMKMGSRIGTARTGSLPLCLMILFLCNCHMLHGQGKTAEFLRHPNPSKDNYHLSNVSLS